MEICSLCAAKHNNGADHMCDPKDTYPHGTHQYTVRPDGWPLTKFYLVSRAISTGGVVSETKQVIDLSE